MRKNKGKRSPFDTEWRRTATAVYKAPSDGRISGTYEVNVSNALKFIEEKKKEGVNITITHLALAAIGRTFAYDVPEMNCYVYRGRIVERDNVGVFVSVDVPETREVTGFVVKDADSKSVFNIIEEMNGRVAKFKAKREEGSVASKNMLAKIPWPFRRPFFLMLKFMIVTFGSRLKFINTSTDSYGSVIMSNIGSFGIQYGFGAILPVSNISTVLLLGKIEQKPVVKNGEIVIGDVMPLAGSFDHRVIDGAMTGRMALAIEKYLMKPEILAEEIEKANDMDIRAESGINEMPV